MIDRKISLKCPFRNFKKCEEQCSFYRKGIRYNELTGENFPIEACAINIIADNLEAMHNRTFMLQREVGKAKDAIVMQALIQTNTIPVEQGQCEIIKLAGPSIKTNDCDIRSLPEKIEEKKKE